LIDIARDLQVRIAEREALLRRIVQQLTTDPRVVAAWLYGSVGRQEADGLSDLDVRLVVADAECEAMLAERRTYIERIAVPLLIQDVPQNGPPGGAFVLVHYAGSAGPVFVDWTWQPQANARIPTDVHLLFDRVGLLPENPTPRPTGSVLADALTEKSIFVWMMVQMAAKKIARQEPWAAIIILNHTQQALEHIKWLLSLSEQLPFFEPRQKGRLPSHPVEQMAQVRALSREMEALTSMIMNVGGQVPIAVIEAAYRFFKLVDAMIADPKNNSHRI
jgi:predicted nucleotidyltransferase